MMIYVTSVQGPNPGMADLNVVHLLCDLRGYESSSWKYYGTISVEYTNGYCEDRGISRNEFV